jgi:hypothetical protein
MSEAVGSNISVEVSQVVQEQPFSSLDLIEVLRRGLIALPEYATLSHLSMLFCKMEEALNSYDDAVKQNAINLEALTEQKASDNELGKIASHYGMTMNQAVGYMDMCDQVNGNMKGTGIIAVPFWFHEQYVELQLQNKHLIEETNTLMATLSKIQEKVAAGELSGLGIELPKRTNIITNSTTPYIAGETGPRIGDEHLDNENVYIPPLKKGRR